MKKKIVLLAALAGVTFVPLAQDVFGTVSIQGVEAQAADIQGRIALGGSLDESGIQQTLDLLGAGNVQESQIVNVDGTLIHSYLNDGSNQATPVYSSALIESREEGYGVQVQIMTPENILHVAPQTYQNAAITAGAKDVLIKIAAASPVTGEGALAGVYALYEAAGQQLNRENISVAQKEIELVNDVQAVSNLTDSQINQLQSNIKIAINELIINNPAFTDEDVSLTVNNMIHQFETEQSVSISDELTNGFVTFALEYAQTDIAQSEETTEQIEASTGSQWTMPQAVDFWEAAFLNPNNTEVSINVENYDRSFWTEYLNQENNIVLHLRNAGAGGSYYEFEKLPDNTIVTFYDGNVSYPENPGIEYTIDNASNTFIEVTYLSSEVVEASESIWNDAKDLALRNFMNTWGESMGQTYQEYTSWNQTSMYGVNFPSDVMSYLGVNNQPVQAFWSEDGVRYNASDYLIVGAYSDDVDFFEKNPTSPYGANYYLFALVDGQPLVLHSQQNQGAMDGLIHFNQTDNYQLQTGFESIVYE